jgi:hypothetical protein
VSPGGGTLMNKFKSKSTSSYGGTGVIGSAVGGGKSINSYNAMFL